MLDAIFSVVKKIASSVNPLGGMDVNVQDFGVPKTFTKQTANGDNFLIQKGQLNKLRLRPQIVNEQMESSRNIHGVVSDGNILGQVFKASHDNINGIDITVESAAGVDLMILRAMQMTRLYRQFGLQQVTRQRLKPLRFTRVTKQCFCQQMVIMAMSGQEHLPQQIFRGTLASFGCTQTKSIKMSKCGYL